MTPEQAIDLVALNVIAVGAYDRAYALLEGRAEK